MREDTHSNDCEIVIGLVSPVGINLEDVKNRLDSLFAQFNYKVNFIHLSKIAENFSTSLTPSASANEKIRLKNGMDKGFEFRKKYKRGDFYSLLAIDAINKQREDVAPLKRHAHIIRSLKNTDEVETLRNVYGDGFFLLGISSSIESREHYLSELKGIPSKEIDALITRDDDETIEDDDDSDYGQQTRDVFQMADAFVTTDDADRLSKQLSRILDLLFSKPVISPTEDEYAMFMAYAASLRSADLSRQVGAVITNEQFDIVATGANDVPKFGGGLYWPGKSDKRDHILKYDSNEKEKNSIILKIMKKLDTDTSNSEESLLTKGKALLKDTGLLRITEYGRSVHAEMEALLSAARNGIPVRGCTLYTTTYPCHNCAKHLVAAGINRVKYVEPYPKSYAVNLHGDSISANGKQNKKKVSFEHFVGVGPRRFVDLFSMNLSSGRKLKRKKDGQLVSWNRSTAELRVPMKPLSYLDAELLLVKELNQLVNEESNNGKQ